jgi:hypothetical protein
MDINQIELSQEIAVFNLPRLKEVVLDVISELSRDLGKKTDSSDLAYITNKISLKLFNQYKRWPLVDFLTAINRGKVGEFGKDYGISVANIEAWIYKHSMAVNQRIINGNIDDQAKRRKEAAEMFQRNQSNCVYGDAVAWKMEQRLLIVSSYPRTSEHYARAMSKINALTLDMVVNAMSKNNVKQLITW